MKKNRITIATRGSALALVQAEWTAARLRSGHPGLVVDLEVIKTRGDKILDVPLAKIGGKGLFVKEIEDALLDGRADLAVHSMKDVPVELPEGLRIAVVPERADCRDTLISRAGAGLSDLPGRARVGTSSLRRRAQILHQRPDLEIVSLRGNVDTRLRKLETENLDAIVLAAAGLNRMNLTPAFAQVLDPGVMLPAIGQGALGLEARINDREVLDLIEGLHHRPTAVCVAAERAFLRTMEGGCQVPLAALARLEAHELILDGLVADPDGRRWFKDSIRVPQEEAEAAGRSLAEDLLDRGGRDVLQEFYSEAPH